MTANEAIKSTRGRWFVAEFVKKDGSLRRMNARTGVRKGITGAGLKFAPSEKGLQTVFDRQKKQFRFINLRTLRSVDCGKLHWRNS